MSVHQYIDEFNCLVSKKDFKISTVNQNFIRSKLDIINGMLNVGTLQEISNQQAAVYIENLQKILECSLTYVVDQAIISNILNFLATILTGNDCTMKFNILHLIQYRVLINLLITNNFGDQEKVMLDLLKVLNDVLKFEKHIEEHSLKLLIEEFKDIDAQQNSTAVIKSLGDLLIDLCFIQPFVKPRILRSIRLTQFVEKLNRTEESDELSKLSSFKFFILTHNQPYPSDLIYFLDICLKTMMANWNIDTINESLDILKIIDDSNESLSEVRLIDNEKVSNLLCNFTSVLVGKIEAAQSYLTPILGKCFEFLKTLIEIDGSITNIFDTLVMDVCSYDQGPTTSREFLDFLAVFVAARDDHQNTKQNIKKFIEHLLDYQADMSWKIKNSFVKLLRNLHIRVSDNFEIKAKRVFNLFDDTLKFYKRSKLPKLTDDESSHFVHAVYALQVFQDVTEFKFLLNDFVNWAFFKVILAQNFMSKSAETIEICIELTKLDNCPTKKVSKLLANVTSERFVNVKSDEDESVPARRNSSIYPSAIKGRLESDLKETIKKIKEVLDNNDFNELKAADVAEIFRYDNENLHKSVDELTSSLEEASRILGNQNKTFRAVSREAHKKDTIIWYLQQEIDLFSEKIIDMKSQYKKLEKSVSYFSKDLERKSEENKRCVEQNEHLQQKVKKIEHDTQEMKKIHDKQMQEKQNEIRAMEGKLVEAEQMKTTILTLMQTKSFK